MFFRKRQASETPAPGGARESTSRPRPAPPAAPSSRIGRSTRFRGEIRGSGSLLVRGVVEGIVGIEDQLVVDAGGRVDADARVSGADVFGEIRGELTTRSLLRIRSGGSVEGRIRAPRLRVDPGGLLQGTIARSEPAAENPLSQPPDVNSQPA